MKKTLIILLAVLLAIILSASSCENNSSDSRQMKQQEVMLDELTKQTGMPNIVNGRERRLLKSILELRDQDGLVTYTYLFSEMTGKLIYLGESMGYGIPYATQYTNPMKPLYTEWRDTPTIPQADPNGLFSPESADGTWIMMLDPTSGEVRPQYIEPKIITLTFRLSKDDPRLG